MTQFIFLFFLFLGPLILLRLERNYKWMNSLLGAYSLGILFSIVSHEADTSALSRQITGAAIVLAIGLLLLGADIQSWFKTGKETFLSAFVYFSIIPLVTVLIVLIFGKEIPDAAVIGGMLTAVYTGSLPNMFVVGSALNAETNSIVVLQLADMTFCGLFSLIILSPAVKKIYGFLPEVQYAGDANQISDSETKISNYILSFVISALLVGLGVLISKLFSPELEQLIIFSIVSFSSVIFALKFPINLKTEANNMGNYFLLVFCVAVGSMVEFDKILQTQNIRIFTLTGLVIFFSVIIHMIFCYLKKVDRDIAIITMTAAIFSPAFVPAVIKNLDNSKLLISGIAAALMGLFIGTYSGFFVSFLINFLKT